jgi:hypothetical protein
MIRQEMYSSYGRNSLEGRANMQDVKNACMILNTAEYCQSTSLQVCPFGPSRYTSGREMLIISAGGKTQGQDRRRVQAGCILRD